MNIPYKSITNDSFLLGSSRFVSMSDVLALIHSENQTERIPHKHHKKRMGARSSRIKQKMISIDNLEKVLAHQKTSRRPVHEALMELGLANEEEIALEMTVHHGFPYLPLSNYEINAEAAKLIPGKIAAQYCVMPIDRISNSLMVAMANPLHTEAIKTMESMSSCSIQIFVSTTSEIKLAITNHYKNTEIAE